MLMRIPFIQLTPDQRAVVDRPGAFQDWKAWSAASSAGRRKKKRKKKKLPKSSSGPLHRQGWRRSLRGRAHRRQRQWYACNAGFTGYDAPRVMFPTGVARPKMLRILAGMDQKDRCSGIFKAGFPGYNTPLAVLCGMARLVLLVTVHLALCFLPCLRARDARRHDRYGPEGISRHVQGLVCSYLTMSLALCSSWLSPRHRGRHGPQYSYVEVHRCSSWTRSLTCQLVCCEWRRGPDSAENCLAIPQVQTLDEFCRARCVQRQCPGLDAQNAGGAAVTVPRQGVLQVQLLDKILVPVVCNDRPSCSRQFRNPWRSHRCRPVSVLYTPRFDSGHIGVSLRCLLEEFPSYFNAMLGSIVDTSSCVTLRRLVFLVTMHLALCSFVVLRPLMLVITACMDQKECFVWPCRKLRIFRSCSSSQVVQFILSLRSGSVSRS